jgi:TPR repeat protein
MWNNLKSLTLAVFILFFATQAFADFHNGWDAYKRGDYVTALKEWQPLAEKGDALAQNALGDLYAIGNGVTQDYKAAFKW